MIPIRPYLETIKIILILGYMELSLWSSIGFRASWLQSIVFLPREQNMELRKHLPGQVTPMRTLELVQPFFTLFEL